MALFFTWKSLLPLKYILLKESALFFFLNGYLGILFYYIFIFYYLLWRIKFWEWGHTFTPYLLFASMIFFCRNFIFVTFKWCTYGCSSGHFPDQYNEISSERQRAFHWDILWVRDHKFSKNPAMVPFFPEKSLISTGGCLVPGKEQRVRSHTSELWLRKKIFNLGALDFSFVQCRK